MDENQDTRCHSCGARVTPEAQWCTLCYATLHHHEAVGQHALGRHAALGQHALGQHALGQHALGQQAIGQHAVDLAPAADLVARAGRPGGAAPHGAPSPYGPVHSSQAEAVADEMLARLAGEVHRPPSLGLLNRSMSTAYGRAGFAAAGVGVVMLLVYGLMTLAGTVL